jgi:hypothetical protein
MCCQNFAVQRGCGVYLSLLVQGTCSFNLLSQWRVRLCRGSRFEEGQEFRFHEGQVMANAAGS